MLLETKNEKGGKTNMNPVIWIALILVFAAIAAFVGYSYRKNMVEKKINRSEETARRL